MNEPAVARGSLREAYQRKLQDGWQSDESQAGAVAQMDALLKTLEATSPRPTKGLYLHGPVGRGKSQLLGMFIEHVSGVKARRVHMHTFVPQLHHRLVEIARGDPVEQMAKELAADCRVLGLDEFYVTDLGDGILLGRLFGFLFKHGVMVVTTSNWPIDGLFQGGRNRQRLLPYIKVLKENLKVIDLGEGRDYRRVDDPSWPLYVLASPESPATAPLQSLFDRYACGEDVPAPEGIKATSFRDRAGWYQFADLCGQALGRIEYERLVGRLDTLIIEGIPSFSGDDSDLALRLVTLIDICYEHRCRVIASAAAYPDQLYTDGPVATAFRRVASRLSEMQAWGEAP